MNEALHTQQKLMQASRPNAVPSTPSFEPWLVYVRTLRAGVTCGVMLITTLKLGWAGTDWIDAVLQGMAAAVVAFFLSWACALWVCSELYTGEIRRTRASWAARERIRQQRIHDLYNQRMDQLHGTRSSKDDALDNLSEFTPPPSNPEQASSMPNSWQQRAA